MEAGEPGGSIADAIKDSFGSFSDFKEKFSSTTAVIQGSGWDGWYTILHQERLNTNQCQTKLVLELKD